MHRYNYYLRNTDKNPKFDNFLEHRQSTDNSQ
jgi:hypothetical protein